MNNKMPNIVSMTVVTSAYGAGQRISAVAIEYSEQMTRGNLEPEQYAVEGYEITNLCVSDTARGEPVWEGHFVQLLLDADPEALSVCGHTGAGPGSRAFVKKPVLHVTQKVPIAACSGRQMDPFSGDTTAVDLGIADRFLVCQFRAKNGKVLTYNLYIPEHMLAGQEYPVVLFMHDLGSCSSDAKTTLLQGTGATVWAIESYYNRRPCFVVAPQYTDQCANDDFEVTWEAEATIELMDFLCQAYPIDRKRIYGTGQSMGTMMLCELMLRHPHYFAGLLLVAGQWDPDRLTAAKDENLWVVVSSGDEKACPTMRKALNNMEAAGGKMAYGHVNARSDAAWIDAAVRSQKQKNANLNMTWFEGRSVVPMEMPVHSGMHHIFTWVKAYDIKALREWLFEQRLP